MVRFIWFSCGTEYNNVDRVDKKQRFKLQNFLLILSTVGLVVSQAYLMSNNYSAKDPVDTFNACIGFALFSYSLM